MIIIAYGMDKFGSRKANFEAKKAALEAYNNPLAYGLDLPKNTGGVTTYSALDFYNTLIPIETGLK
jgi:hypothetical protein